MLVYMFMWLAREIYITSELASIAHALYYLAPNTEILLHHGSKHYRVLSQVCIILSIVY